MKRDLTKIFIEEIYSKPPKKKYPTKKIVYNLIDEIWSIDLLDLNDYKTSNNRRYRYILRVIDNFSKYGWTVPLKNKSSQIISDEFSKILATSKRSPLKIESDRGKEFYKKIFQIFLKLRKIQHFSRYFDKGPSIAERFNRSIRDLLKKPLFQRGDANWVNILPSLIKQYDNRINSSTKMTPNLASKKSNEKEVYSNLQD